MARFRLIMSWLLLGTCFSVQAQSHRFIYEVEFKKDSTESLITKDFYHLDIIDDDVAYYHRDYFILDSLNSAGVTLSGASFSGGNPNLSNVITTKTNSDKYDEFELLEYEALKLVSKPVQTWVLSNETKIIDGMPAQKAETKWGGRYWTAWFTKQIPLNYGPYKFHGLPGLILQISDSKNNYNFTLVKSQKLASNKLLRPLSLFNPANTTDEQYRRKKLSNYEDPLGFINTTEIAKFKDEVKGIYLKDGTMVTRDNIREVRRQQQKMIKKYNNPIELDKAIHYPEKGD